MFLNLVVVITLTKSSPDQMGQAPLKPFKTKSAVYDSFGAGSPPQMTASCRCFSHGFRPPTDPLILEQTEDWVANNGWRLLPAYSVLDFFCSFGDFCRDPPGSHGMKRTSRFQNHHHLGGRCLKDFNQHLQEVGGGRSSKFFGWGNFVSVCFPFPHFAGPHSPLP